MRTVITPDALVRSKFKPCHLAEWKDLDGELFFFRYPSPDAITRANGDGDLMEVMDFARDLSSIDVDMGHGRTKTIVVYANTVLYYR